MTRIFSGKVTLDRPTREDVLNLQVGDIAPYVFGEAKVVSIFARGEDKNGKAYVCYYVDWNARNSIMSASLKEGEVVRSMSACNAHTSNELRAFDERA